MLLGHATRVHLLGAVELYTVAIYADRGGQDDWRLESDHIAKAIRIQIRNPEEMRRETVIDWRRELVPRLDAAATAHISGVFAPLRHADTVIISYVPGKGTTLRVNSSVTASAAHHDLMLAFLDHWLGQRPLSEYLKRALLRESPSANF